jgi:predicted RNA-binding protein (virulence factor B family)
LKAADGLRFFSYTIESAGDNDTSALDDSSIVAMINRYLLEGTVLYLLEKHKHFIHSNRILTVYQEGMDRPMGMKQVT